MGLTVVHYVFNFDQQLEHCTEAPAKGKQDGHVRGAGLPVCILFFSCPHQWYSAWQESGLARVRELLGVLMVLRPAGVRGGAWSVSWREAVRWQPRKRPRGQVRATSRPFLVSVAESCVHDACITGLSMTLGTRPVSWQILSSA